MPLILTKTGLHMKTNRFMKQCIHNFDAVVTGATLTACVTLVNLNVIMRYFFNHPLQWCDEIVTSLFVWTVFIGSAYAHRKHAHLGVDILVNLFSPAIRQKVRLLFDILQILVLGMITYISGQYVYSLIYVRGKYKLALTDMLRLPKWWTGIAVPIGFGLSLIYALYFFYQDYLKKKEHRKEGGEVV